MSTTFILAVVVAALIAVIAGMISTKLMNNGKPVRGALVVLVAVCLGVVILNTAAVEAEIMAPGSQSSTESA